MQPSGGALEENLVVLGVVFRVIVNVCFCESISLLDIRCQMMFGTVASRKLDQRVENEKNSEMSFRKIVMRWWWLNLLLPLEQSVHRALG